MDDVTSTRARTQTGAPTLSGEALGHLSCRLWAWFGDTALPLWWRVGADHARGGFHEALGQDGVPVALPRRCRVQPRQIHAFSLAARLGWRGPAGRAAEHGLSYFLDRFRRPDGLFRASVEIDGRARDDRAFLYDQAFALLGLHAAHDLDPRPELRSAAEDLLARVRRRFEYPGGGFREEGDAPFQSNAQMHLFEACIAWGAVAGGPFAQVADEIGALCLERLIDPGAGVIDEVYDAAWRPVAPEGGAGGERRIEPGHQFEWAWLLMQWDQAGVRGCRAPAERLFAAGEASVCRARHAVPAAMSPEGRVFEPVARLWPQTERLRTAALLAGEAGADRSTYERAALDAGEGLLMFLRTPVAGLWRDKRLPDGTFVEEAAPASSLYHLAEAIGALKERFGGAEPPMAASSWASETAR